MRNRGVNCGILAGDEGGSGIADALSKASSRVE